MKDSEKIIDKTKENIGVSGLDEHTRKDLYNKFIEAGGQVIEEKRNRIYTEFDREKQKQFLKEFERQKKKNSRETRKQKKLEEAARLQLFKQSRDKKHEPGPFSLFIDRIYIRLKLVMMGVIEFNGNFLKTKFLDHLDTEYKRALNEMQLIFIDLFQQNEHTGKRIISQLDRLDPINYELCELMAGVFDRSTIIKLLEHYTSYPSVPQRAVEIKDPVISILKKLYPLYRYRELIKFSFEKAFKIKEQYDKNKSSGYPFQKRELKNNLYVIFEKLYPRLYWLICHFQGRILMPGSLERIISVSAEDKPGRREKEDEGAKFELPFIEDDGDATDTEEQNEEREDELSGPEKRGLELIKKLDLQKQREAYDRDGLFRDIDENDKILIIYLLFLEFDHEYSFLLTTNKIKFNIVAGPSEKKDYKISLVTIYNTIGKCYDRFKIYADTMRTYKKLLAEKPSNNTHYIEYTNRLSAIEKEIYQSSNEVRVHTKLFLERLSKELKEIIDDTETGQLIISNPDDDFTFDAEIEGEKKLNNTKISESFIITYNYISAFLYRLGPRGDLSSGIEFKEEDKTIFDTHAPEEGETEKNKTEDESPLKSIAEELDDFV